MQLTLNASYYTNISWDLELPEGRTWAEVKEAHVKWDNLFIVWKDGSESAITMIHADEVSDTKRPLDFTVWDDETDDEVARADNSSWYAEEDD